MPPSDSPLLAHLSLNSEPYHDPLARLDWSALSLDDPWLPASALSLTGVAVFEAQPPLVKLRLSQYEFLHFIEAGLWLEQIFIERLGEMLRRTDSRAEYAYHLHEIREEVGHSLMFLKLMAQSGLHLPSTPPPRMADWLGRHVPVNSTLFWLAVTLGEEVPDKLNRHVRAHGAGVNPLICQMCTLHLMDEARHIARARTELETRAADLSAPMRALLTPLASWLVRQFARRFYLPRPAVYELAGLTPGIEWQEMARVNPVRIEFVRQALSPTVNALARCGIEAGEVKL